MTPENRIELMKILVVDDSKSVLELAKDILTIHKYEVETAENGAQALDKYFKFKPDIVTLDLAMPIIDGYETLKRILALDRDAKVVMLTASEQQDVVERCLEKGAIGYIIKPFAAKDLVAAITNAWKASSDKNVVTLFSFACNKIQDSIRKMINSDVSVTVSQVIVIRQEVSTQMLSSRFDVSQIKAVSKTVEHLKIEAPDDAVGYVTEIWGQQHGILISFIQEKNLASLFNIGGVDDQHRIFDQPVEFFDIINQKILSELANATHLILDFKPTRLYNTNDKDAPAKMVAKATFEIVIKQQRIPIEFQLWFETGGIFRARF